MSNEQVLFTVQQLADMQGITSDGMRKRINKLEIAPVIPEKRTHQGTVPAYYDYNALSKIQEEAERRLLIKLNAAAAKKIAEGMSLVGQHIFIRMAYDELTSEQKTAFMEELRQTARNHN